MLPLWHQEVLIMMMTGMEHVPSDICNDLKSCNGEQVQIYMTYTETQLDRHTHSYNLNPLGLTNRLVFKTI